MNIEEAREYALSLPWQGFPKKDKNLQTLTIKHKQDYEHTIRSKRL